MKEQEANPVVAHLSMLVSAHPGLVLRGEERATFERECPDLETIAAASSANAEALIQCAWAYRKLAKFDHARRMADAAIAADRSWKSLTAKASVCRAMGDVNPAIALFDEAATLDPTDTSALMEGARTLGEAERLEDAAIWFGRVVDRDASNTEALLWREYCLHCLTKSPKHVDNVRAVLKGDPHNGVAAELLGYMTG
jgi:tetratricopeptide (TPR) repeat protein